MGERYVNYDTESIYEVWVVPARTRWRKKPGHRAEIRRLWSRLAHHYPTREDWKLRHKTKVRATASEAIRDANDWLTKQGVIEPGGEN